MPIIAYGCSCGHVEKKYYRSPKNALRFIACIKCNKDMKKLLSTPNSSSKVVIDNGFQGRAIEVDPNIAEINEKRSNINLRKID